MTLSTFIPLPEGQLENGTGGVLKVGITNPGRKGAAGTTTAISAVGVVFNLPETTGNSVDGCGAPSQHSGWTGHRTCVLSASFAQTKATDNATKGLVTTISTNLTAAFNAAVMFDDHSTLNYAVTAWDKDVGAAADADANPMVFRPDIIPAGDFTNANVNRTDDGTPSPGPNIRRLVQLGYL
jgi:hypothetical protein